MKVFLLFLLLVLPILAQIPSRPTLRRDSSGSRESRPNRSDSRNSREDHSRSSEESRLFTLRIMTREGCRIYHRQRGQCTKQSCDGQSIPISVEQCHREFQSLTRRDQ